MSDKTDKGTKAIALDSASVPRMQSITELSKVGTSATIPPMQLAPSQSPTQQNKQNAAVNNSSNKSGK
jgi:hypothetical protein